jgi:hypothetical protein
MAYTPQPLKAGQIIPAEFSDNACAGQCVPEMENNKPLYDWIIQN